MAYFSPFQANICKILAILKEVYVCVTEILCTLRHLLRPRLYSASTDIPTYIHTDKKYQHNLV